VSVEELIASSPEEERSIFRKCCEHAQAVLVIAPEIDDQLSRRVAQARYWTHGAVWNVTIGVSRLTSDKFASWQCLEKHDVSAIPTALLTDGPRAFPFPVVVKPRYGAGSQDTFLCRSEAEIRAASSCFAAVPKER
jgi:predicted ATP-grasp superfamily ATP-dependent carboligase